MSSYDAIAELYDPWSRSVTEDVGFYVAEARKAGGTVVELGVGTGRIAVPVASAGVPVIGVDSSQGMLEVCRRRAEAAGVSRLVDLRQGDLRDPPVTQRVRLVTSPFRALLHAESDEDRRAALAAAFGLLVPGGRLVFDVFAPSPEDVAETNGRWLEREPAIWERADWDMERRVLTLRGERRGGRDRHDALLDPHGGLAPPPGGDGLRDHRLLRLVRPAPVRRRRGLHLARAPSLADRSGV